jgi:DnaJ-class molecular chaperone
MKLPHDYPRPLIVVCTGCYGTGRDAQKAYLPCPTCEGEGWVAKARVTIPPPPLPAESKD